MNNATKRIADGMTCLEQALAMDIFGPLNPNFSEAYPDNVDIAPGTKKEKSFLDPF